MINFFNFTIDIHSHMCYIIYRLSLALLFKKRKALLRYNTQQITRRTAHAPGYLSAGSFANLRIVAMATNKKMGLCYDNDRKRKRGYAT